VSFSVEPGELYCFTGADGAGKSTLIRILAGTLRPDAGAVTLLGADGIRRPQSLRYEVGYMPQRFAIYADLTAEENLSFYCSFYGLDRASTGRRVAELLELTRLAGFRSFAAGSLSGGMKQKLVLGCSLVHSPRLLLLDEPTTGIDPLSRREFWAILTDFLARGTTILYSTVYLEEALRSSRIALMVGGRIAACASPEALLGRARGRRFTVAPRDRERAIAALNASPAVVSVQPLGDAVAFLAAGEPGAADAARAALAGVGVFEPVEPAHATLEDVLILAGGAA
jgi:ABC-2 type transport system ATP-binding protein